MAPSSEQPPRAIPPLDLVKAYRSTLFFLSRPTTHPCFRCPPSLFCRSVQPLRRASTARLRQLPTVPPRHSPVTDAEIRCISPVSRDLPVSFPSIMRVCEQSQNLGSRRIFQLAGLLTLFFMR